LICRLSGWPDPRRVLTYEEKLRQIVTAKQRPGWQSMRLAMTLAEYDDARI
jgi:hypothetical protein